MPDIGLHSEGLEIVRNRKIICTDDHCEASCLDPVECHASFFFQFLNIFFREDMPQLLTLPAHWWAIVYLPQDEFIAWLLLSTPATGPGAEVLLLVFWAYYGLTHRVKMRFENVVELAAHPEPLHTRST